MDLRDRLSMAHPVVQAGMGGGLARAELAAAVSNAGGLGTLGIMPPAQLAHEIRRFRELAPGRPLAVNLLVPFLRRAHVRVCAEGGVDAVVFFFGFAAQAVASLRNAGIMVLHQVGEVTEARKAVADGADGLIAQGTEAGGHLRAVYPLRTALPRILSVADGRPVLAAGGISAAEGVRELLDAGAAAAVAGTRFLLTEECHAHPLYQARVLGARTTMETELFGFGWPARHRVVPNAATERWCGSRPAGARAVLAVNGRTARLGGAVPLGALRTMTTLQHPRVPFFGPGPALRGMPERVVDAAALYAGEGAGEIRSVVPAAVAVRQLAGLAPTL